MTQRSSADFLEAIALALISVVLGAFLAFVALAATLEMTVLDCSDNPATTECGE